MLNLLVAAGNLTGRPAAAFLNPRAGSPGSAGHLTFDSGYTPRLSIIILSGRNSSGAAVVIFIVPSYNNPSCRLLFVFVLITDPGQNFGFLFLLKPFPVAVIAGLVSDITVIFLVARFAHHNSPIFITLLSGNLFIFVLFMIFTLIPVNPFMIFVVFVPFIPAVVGFVMPVVMSVIIIPVENPAGLMVPVMIIIIPGRIIVIIIIVPVITPRPVIQVITIPDP